MGWRERYIHYVGVCVSGWDGGRDTYVGVCVSGWDGGRDTYVVLVGRMEEEIHM